jgi:ABC-type nitrate/sulfonate/bicarbonate transport system substrate-binding protein
MVVINGSTNRVAALQAGELDTARLEIVDWLQLERQVPGKFSVLIDFGKEFPLVQFSSFTVRRAWAEQNPEAVKDFIRALLTAHRRVAGNPQLFSEQIVKYLSLPPADATIAADAYLKLGVWDVSGGLTDTSIDYMIDFLTTAGSLPGGVKPNDVADLPYLNAVLDDIGRK